MNAEAICRLAPVIPVLTIEEAAHAVPLARALARGGLSAIEITLRTPAALPAIRTLTEAVPDTIVGAGTLLTPRGRARRGRRRRPVRCLARPHRPSARRRRGCRSADATGRRDPRRGEACTRTRPRRAEVLSRRPERRSLGPRCLSRASATGPLLSDRRHSRPKRRRSPRNPERSLHWRQLVRATLRSGGW